MGTVQLGMPYGRNSQVPVCSVEMAEAVLEKAWQFGIRDFDTAHSYGDSSHRLSKWLKKTGNVARASVITKIPPHALENKEFLTDLISPFLGAENITVLTHGAVQDDKKWRLFRGLAESFGIHYGQSVYSADEVVQACKLGCELIQAPGNAIDDRQIRAAKDFGVSIDVRSVFLQGLLLDDPITAESRVYGGGALSKAVKETAVGLGIPQQFGLICSVLYLLGEKGRLVLGADSPSEIVGWFTSNYSREIADTFMFDLRLRLTGQPPERLLDPRQWK